MRSDKRHFRTIAVRVLTAAAACTLFAAFAAGCDNHKVDKYTVTDADRRGAASVVDPKNALPGGELQQTNTGAKPASDAKTP